MGNSMKQSMIPMTSGRVAATAYRWGRFVFRATRRSRARPGQYAIAASEPRSRRDRRRVLPPPARRRRDPASGHSSVFRTTAAVRATRRVPTVIDDASTRTWWMRERRRRGVDVAGWWCKTQDICDGTSASRASPSDHKNTSDKNSKAVLRISVITLIRTDTTLDLSQKAEKGKSPLSRPESRFSAP